MSPCKDETVARESPFHAGAMMVMLGLASELALAWARRCNSERLHGALDQCSARGVGDGLTRSRNRLVNRECR